jgi:hypothetical protein
MYFHDASLTGVAGLGSGAGHISRCSALVLSSVISTQFTPVTGL